MFYKGVPELVALSGCTFVPVPHLTSYLGSIIKTIFSLMRLHTEKNLFLKKAILLVISTKSIVWLIISNIQKKWQRSMAAEPLSLGHWRQSRCHWSLAAKPLSLVWRQSRCHWSLKVIEEILSSSHKRISLL
ncbi:MAG: hypothetical protein IPP34_20155 [Bacteroidetes bacterium]|nr:hypothetical protein [Bacteroidota bacterium]